MGVSIEIDTKISREGGYSGSGIEGCARMVEVCTFWSLVN
jgi:hypothetical protein